MASSYYPPKDSGGGGNVASINALTAADQFLSVGSTGTDFTVTSTLDTHTFNLPDAGAASRGVVSTGTQTFAGEKTFTSSILIADGGEASPALSFSSSSNLGIYRISATSLGISTSGVGIAAFATTTIQLRGSASNPLRITSALGNPSYIEILHDGSDNAIFRNTASSSLILQTNSIGRLSISSSGRVAVGLETDDQDHQVLGAAFNYITNSPTQIFSHYRSVDTGSMRFIGGSTISSAYVEVYGSSHATSASVVEIGNSNGVLVRASGTGLFNFGIADTASSFNIRNSLVTLADQKTTAGNIDVLSFRNDTATRISGGTASGLGGEIRLFAQSHATTPRNVELCSNDGVRLRVNGTTGNVELRTSSRLLLEDGSASLPSLGFNTSSSGYGIYLKTAQQLGFAANGADSGYIDQNGSWFIGIPNFGSALYLRTNYTMYGQNYTTANFTYAEQLFRNDWLWRMMASDDTSKGAQLLLGGESHATYANTVEFRTNNASRFTINSSGVVVSVGQHRVGSLGVGNSAAATTPGTVVAKIEVFDGSGVSLGFLPVYDVIT